jgi:hypothetical protein
MKIGKIKLQRKDLDSNFYQNERPVVARFNLSKVYPDLTDHKTIT